MDECQARCEIGRVFEWFLQVKSQFVLTVNSNLISLEITVF